MCVPVLCVVQGCGFTLSVLLILNRSLMWTRVIIIQQNTNLNVFLWIYWHYWISDFILTFYIHITVSLFRYILGCQRSNFAMPKTKASERRDRQTDRRKLFGNGTLKSIAKVKPFFLLYFFPFLSLSSSYKQVKTIYQNFIIQLSYGLKLH